MSARPTSTDLAAMLHAAAAHHRAGRLDEAARGYAAVLAASPGNADALHLSGVIALQRGDPASAARQIAQALARNPRLADAEANLGEALRALGQPQQAEAAWTRALALSPGQLAARLGRAAVRRDLGDFAGAALDAEGALAHAPPGALAAAQPAADRARICDWSRRREDLAVLRQSLAAGAPQPSPLVVLALLDDPAALRRMAEILAPPSALATVAPPVRRAGGPLRVGFLAGELGNTALWQLAVEAIECLDRTRVEPVGLFWGNVRPDPLRTRIEQAFARVHLCPAASDAALIDFARNQRLDIAIDMTGYTRGARPALFAARVAPVQVNWLGWPGTMGGASHDYIVLDQVIAPRESDHGFSEAVVRLPHSYQPNDRRRAIVAPLPSREQVGLPPTGFVFACFNQPYKIDPEIFEIWMNIVRETPGSLLWLLGGLPQAIANLRTAAARAGLAPERLVFAPPLPGPAHRARLALADLALDTAPCNGHTTTSDALWAGLPVLTCAGQSFASRVAASLLTAAGLPDLVAETHDDYAALALSLARSPDRLAALRERVRAARSSALFDTPAYAAAFAAALEAMHARRLSGQPPAPITVAAD